MLGFSVFSLSHMMISLLVFDVSDRNTVAAPENTKKITPIKNAVFAALSEI